MNSLVPVDYFSFLLADSFLLFMENRPALPPVASTEKLLSSTFIALSGRNPLCDIYASNG